MIHVWEGQLAKTGRGRVFVKCTDKSRIEVSSLGGHENVEVVMPQERSFLNEFVRADHVTSGYIGMLHSLFNNMLTVLRVRGTCHPRNVRCGREYVQAMF